MGGGTNKETRTVRAIVQVAGGRVRGGKIELQRHRDRQGDYVDSFAEALNYILHTQSYIITFYVN